MQYVAAQGLMHRDIAARNCLLTKELVLKIADFGLTIKMSARTEVQGKVPVKWLAREVRMGGIKILFNLINSLFSDSTTWNILETNVSFVLSTSIKINIFVFSVMYGHMVSYAGRFTTMEQSRIQT